MQFNTALNSKDFNSTMPANRNPGILALDV